MKLITTEILAAIKPKKWDKGDRIIVKLRPDRFYLGTVKKVDAKGIRIKFDNGKIEVIEKDSKDIKGIGVDKERRNAFRKADVKKYSATRKEIANKPAKKKPMPRGTAKAKISKKAAKDLVVKKSLKQIPEATEKFFSKRVYDKYEKASQGSDADKKAYFRMIWNVYNRKLFKGKLPKGAITFAKNTGVSFRRRGAYFPHSNELRLHRRLFNAPWLEFITVFIHEMCHQAARQIDKVTDKEKSHGVTWIKWMRHCGLRPDAKDFNTNDVYMSDEEKENFADQKQSLKENTAKEVRTYPNRDKPAKWYDPKSKKWNHGLIVCAHDRQGKRWAFISKPYTDKWQIVPAGWFYEIDHNEKAQEFLKPEFLKAAERIRDNYMQKQAVRRARKQALTFP